MSYRLTEQVIRVDGPAAPLTAPLKAVLGSLASHAHDDGTEAKPGVDRIRRETSLSRRWVQMSLRELEATKLIKVTKKATRYDPTVYAINIRALAALPKIPQGRTQDAPRAGAHYTSSRGAPTTPKSVLESGTTDAKGQRLAAPPGFHDLKRLEKIERLRDKDKQHVETERRRSAMRSIGGPDNPKHMTADEVNAAYEAWCTKHKVRA